MCIQINQAWNRVESAACTLFRKGSNIAKEFASSAPIGPEVSEVQLAVEHGATIESRPHGGLARLLPWRVTSICMYLAFWTFALPPLLKTLPPSHLLIWVMFSTFSFLIWTSSAAIWSNRWEILQLLLVMKSSACINSGRFWHTPDTSKISISNVSELEFLIRENISISLYKFDF